VTEQFLRERAGRLRVCRGPRGRLGHRHGHARRRRQCVGAHRSHATAAARLRDHERPPLARPPGLQRHQQVDAPGGDVVRPVDALVADDIERGRAFRRPEQARPRQRLQERLDLALQLLPDGVSRRLEHRPARAALEAGHEQQLAALRGEQARVGAGRRAACQGPERERPRARRAQRVQRVDAVRGEARALGFGEHELGPHRRPQQQFLVGSRLPGRPLLVQARERARDGTAVGKSPRAGAQAVERLDAGEAHQRVLRAELELAQAAQCVVATAPGRRRVDDQQRVVLAAVATRHQQSACADVAVALERRDADESHVLGGGEREHAGAGLGRADHVVVGERAPVVTVGVRVDVPHRMPRSRRERARRPRRGHRPANAHELRLLQHRGHVARRAGHHRDAAEDFLFLDVVGAARAHALHDQVEAVGLGRADVVVVNRGTQRFARARTQRLERERLVVAGKGDGGGRPAVQHADDDRAPATALEELLDGVRQRARLPQPAEHLVELGEVPHRDRPVDRAAQGAADEGRDGGRQQRDRVVRARPLRHDDAAR